MTFLLLFNDLRVHCFAVMVTGMHFFLSLFFFSSKISKKNIYKRKNVLMTFFCCFINFYDPKYLNSTKKWLSNKKIRHFASSNFYKLAEGAQCNGDCVLVWKKMRRVLSIQAYSSHIDILNSWFLKRFDLGNKNYGKIRIF